MDGPNAWELAAVGAGRTALGASFFPLGAALAYAAARTYGAVMAVLLPGGVLFGLACLATLGLLAAGARGGRAARATAAGLLSGAVMSLFLQVTFMVAVAGLLVPGRPMRRQQRP